jgi:LuxR family maltose regulon positive regulatory protein
VKDIAREENFPADGDAFKPGQNVTTVTEISALAWARVAIASGKYVEAIGLLRQWVTFGEAHGAITAQLRANILLARAYNESGNLRAAVRAFREAIRLASSTGLVFNLLEECGQIQALLEHVLEDESEKYGFILDKLYARVSTGSAIVQRAITSEGHRAAEVASETEPGKALTGREAEILEYVSQSLLNKEIADRLGLTEGSVKWYMQSIYSKLGVRRRMAALDKARALGYLH